MGGCESGWFDGRAGRWGCWCVVCLSVSGRVFTCTCLVVSVCVCVCVCISEHFLLTFAALLFCVLLRVLGSCKIVRGLSAGDVFRASQTMQSAPKMAPGKAVTHKWEKGEEREREAWISKNDIASLP